MNTYKIIFTRENGTQGTDHFTAINERQARKDFGERYRHGTATIISIELASTNAPATKQQERDTLEKIRKMVEQLGPDSYLATAFKGCFDLAAENIDNDWACSMADRARRAEKRAAELEDKLAESVKDYESRQQIHDDYGWGFITEARMDRLMELWDAREESRKKNANAIYEDHVTRMLDTAWAAIGEEYVERLHAYDQKEKFRRQEAERIAKENNERTRLRELGQII